MERVSLPDSAIAIEGQFEPPVLARLSAEDQVFVMTFVQVHGSIKEMERIFGISYPTVKNRLDAIAEQLPLVETVAQTSESASTPALKSPIGGRTRQLGTRRDRRRRGAAEALLMLPPMFLRLRVHNDKRRIRLWIPLIVLWPLVFVVVLLGTPVALLVAARSGHRARSRSVLLAGPLLLYVLASLRGLRCDVASGEDRVFISID